MAPEESGRYGIHFLIIRHLIHEPMPPTPAENLVRARLAAAPGGMMSFAEVMDVALYDAGCGYYGRRPVRIGRQGDFYTAVSVGPLYGRLLAEVVEKTWLALGRPAEFFIIEQGAHDGQLMEDVIHGLRAMKSPLAENVRALIVEGNAAYRAAQAARLRASIGDRTSWLREVDGLREAPANACFLTNELLDALPVHRVRWTGCEWVEQRVALSEGDRLVWRDARPTDPLVVEEIARLPRNLPPGYTTEVHPAAVKWMEQIQASSFRGTLLVADYGLEDHEYYAPERTDGTLRRYVQHRTDGDVLSSLGECDLTAHINFTRVIDAARAGGFTSVRCLDQGRFLTRLGASWLRSLEGRAPSAETAAQLRQFHTLTHPAHMGVKFRLCLLGRGVDAAGVV